MFVFLKIYAYKATVACCKTFIQNRFKTMQNQFNKAERKQRRQDEDTESTAKDTLCSLIFNQWVGHSTSLTNTSSVTKNQLY